MAAAVRDEKVARLRDRFEWRWLRNFESEALFVAVVLAYWLAIRKWGGIPALLFYPFAWFLFIMIVSECAMVAKGIVRVAGGRSFFKPLEKTTCKGWLKDLGGLLLAMLVFPNILSIFLSFVPMNRLTGLEYPLSRHAYSLVPPFADAYDNNDNRITASSTFGAVWVHKWGPDGRLLWSQFASGYKNYNPRLRLDDEGNIYMVGWLVEKFSPDGKLVRTYEGVIGVESEWRISGDGDVVLVSDRKLDPSVPLPPPPPEDQ